MNIQYKFLVTYPRYGVITVLLLFGLAMITYGGGTIIDPEAIGHDFLRNFLSDLGKFSSGNMASMIVGFLSIPIFKFLVPNLDTIGIIFEKQQNY